MRQFIVYHGLQHPRDLGPREVETFLTALAVDRHVSASTQTRHCLRSFSRIGRCSWLLEDGYDIRTVQQLLGHADVSTMMI